MLGGIIETFIVPATSGTRSLTAFNTHSLDISESFSQNGFDGLALALPEATAHAYILSCDAFRDWTLRSFTLP